MLGNWLCCAGRRRFCLVRRSSGVGLRTHGGPSSTLSGTLRMTADSKANRSTAEARVRRERRRKPTREYGVWGTHLEKSFEILRAPFGCSQDEIESQAIRFHF